MESTLPQKLSDGSFCLTIDAQGTELLHNPLLNKGTAFSKEERTLFGLEGLLPPHVSSLEEQVIRTYSHFRQKSSDLGKHIQLRALQDRNETLFYALVSRYLEEMLPIIYTPTVGEAVQLHSHIFRFARGLYISPENVRRIPQMVRQLPSSQIEMIVATDNQGILGIGDQGVGGMTIPIGKLSLYTLCAGIHPSLCLPISLDVGTDNEALLQDPLYLGLKHKRLTGKAYAAFMDQFVEEIRKCYPKALVQWEDLSKQNAFTLLDQYRDGVLSFNDDIQGTGAVATAGILNAVKMLDQNFADQVFCIYGAGAGGIGVARQIYQTLLDQGVSTKSAKEKIFVIDSRGLVVTGLKAIEDYKRPFAVEPARIAGWKLDNTERITLSDVIRNAKVTVLAGLSGTPGAFTQETAKAMLANTQRPIIFPLSNPTSKVEATPQQLIEWTKARAIVATGSPFGPVTYQGKSYPIGQGNNVFIFPGVGLGALVSGAKKITDGMFTQAAYKLAEMGSIYPSVQDLRKVALEIATTVFYQALKEGVAKKPPREPREMIEEKMWAPDYVPYKKQ